MTIYFKNGEKVKVTQEVVDCINKRLIEGTAAQWQSFADEKGMVYLIINLSEVSFIF
jgi:hypothetical protein